jgi:hypothetical protein
MEVAEGLSPTPVRMLDRETRTSNLLWEHGYFGAVETWLREQEVAKCGKHKPSTVRGCLGLAKELKI